MLVELRIKKRTQAMLLAMMLLILGVLFQVRATAENDMLDMIEFSSYLGGTDDESMGVSYAFGDTVVDSKGNIILVGASYSDDFPTKNALQNQLNGARDSIIAKFHPNGSLIFSTYLGGSSIELITGVVIDSQDNIIVAGITSSSDYPLETPYQSTLGGVDCFITKISEDGQSILYSTVFGGTNSDWLYALGIDSNDRIVITGTTASTDFPLLNPAQSTSAGNLDVFFSYFEADGQSLIFSTYLGTSGIDHGRQVGFDSNGDLILAGMIANGNLATEGAFQEEYGGGSSDAFVAKYKANGTLEYLTFLGGTDVDTGNDMVIDNDDNVIVTGYTLSDDYPVLNAIQADKLDRAEMFITKINPDGQSVVFSTYLTGSAGDYGNAIKVDSQNRIIATGQTNSNDFPITHSMGMGESDYDNTILVVLSRDGSLLFSTVFGGAHDDIGIGITWHSNDTFVIAGYTKSPDFPVYQAYQTTHCGSNDMFIMMINLEGLIDEQPAGFTFGIIENSMVIGTVVVVLLVLLVWRRTR